MVLREIHKEKEEEEEGEMVKVIIWCHLGHSYITKVNEGERKIHCFAATVVRCRQMIGSIIFGIIGIAKRKKKDES